MDGENNKVVTKEKTYISKVGEIIEKRRKLNRKSNGKCICHGQKFKL